MHRARNSGQAVAIKIITSPPLTLPVPLYEPDKTVKIMGAPFLANLCRLGFLVGVFNYFNITEQKYKMTTKFSK
jgi:hypothetical protein